MNANECPREAEILLAVRTGAWTEEIRDHARGCPQCADALLVTTWLTEGGSSAQEPLPDPDLIWWKAQILARHEAVKRATRPIALIQRASLVAGAAAAIAVLGWAWPLISNLPRLLASGLAQQPVGAIAVPMTTWGIVLVITLGFLPVGIVLSVLSTLRAGR